MQRLRTNALLSFSALFAACAVGPDYVRPEPAVPTAWQDHGAGVAVAAADVDRWWTGFRDPVLDRLVVRALAGNRDIRQAVARVAESRARYRATASERFP
jgi:outer membrane protein TolC